MRICLDIVDPLMLWTYPTALNHALHRHTVDQTPPHKTQTPEWKNDEELDRGMLQDLYMNEKNVIPEMAKAAEKTAQSGCPSCLM